MCGIAGIVVPEGPPPMSALRAMQSRLRHRGPDSQGHHAADQIALAHTRLSIIDVEGGQQPFFDEQGRYCLIANGEIYNFQSVRQDLERQGHKFRSRSDCEVMLPLYERYGENCVDHLRGMFAFAVWDKRKRQLFLGRDRMGEKPLYYAFTEKGFVFASELRAILASGLVDTRLDAKQVARYFKYQYVPEPFTPFHGVKKLSAGSTLMLDADAWKIHEQRYWNAWDAEPIDADPKTAIRNALEDAVKTSLVSDVPLGVSLSGGIDSSILACLMKAYSDKPIHAISIGYPNASAVDERGHARQLAQRLGIEFHDVELHDSEMLANFRDVVLSRDDPIGDLSGYNYFAIMQHAKSVGLKVMLQGHGVDELCWGYPWVRNSVSLNEGRRPPMAMFKGNSTRSKLGSLVRYLRDRSTPLPREFTMFEFQPYASWVNRNAQGLFTPDFVNESDWSSLSPSNEYGSTDMRVDLEVTRLIVDYYLLENGIAQGDRLSMAHSVEMRLPFVDHKLVETIVGLRKSERDDHLPLKYWIKESVRDLLGDEILDRPKRGFEPPGDRWQASLRDVFGPELIDGFLVQEGILTQKMARRLVRPVMRDSAEAAVSRMAIILEIWARGTILGEDGVQATSEFQNVA